MLYLLVFAFAKLGFIITGLMGLGFPTIKIPVSGLA
jgi:hypothetical protein